ncbi:MAG: amidohydrolase family protein [Lentisphaeria bacterium]|nr:amidohydrolase family protein [Lentisphaeria bacterium]
MIIDLNAHLGHYAFRRLRHNTAPALLELMDRSGIDKAVVSSVPSLFYRDAHAGNEELRDAVMESHGRLIPIATINPTYAEWERDLDEAVTNWRFRAVRLLPQYHAYSLADDCGQAVMRAATERGVPVAVHQRIEDRRMRHHLDTVDDLDLGQVVRAAKSVPDVRLLFLNCLRIPVEAIKEAGLEGRVLIDFTRMAAVLTKSIPALLESLGAGALGFGSHIPFNYPAPALIKLEIVDVSEEDRERITWRNAAAFLSIDD